MDLLTMMLEQHPDQTFEKFWSAYPKKDKKIDALRAWRKLLPDAATVQAILDALAWQREQKSWRDRQFIPLPASYLRGEYWNNEPPPHIKRLLAARAPLPQTDAEREHVWRIQQSIAERNRLDLIDAEQRRAEYLRTHPWAR